MGKLFLNLLHDILREENSKPTRVDLYIEIFYLFKKFKSWVTKSGRKSKK